MYGVYVAMSLIGEHYRQFIVLFEFYAPDMGLSGGSGSQ